MTLILTELTQVGITMATDSAITKFGNGGRIIEIDQKGWQKLLRIPRITAGLSYWGMIGAITTKQFDHWLQQIIAQDNYNDLNSFADYLVTKLNSACKNKPLKNGYEVGFHLAGYGPWDDNVLRPVFYHIHNGHGRLELKKDNKTNLFIPNWISEPRKLFEKHLDFPNPQNTSQKNIDILNETGWITRNGDYLLYAVLQEQIVGALDFLKQIPNVKIPSDPRNLASRRNFIHTLLECVVRLYRCSNLSKVVGGNVTSLAIGPNGFVN